MPPCNLNPQLGESPFDSRTVVKVVIFLIGSSTNFFRDRTFFCQKKNAQIPEFIYVSGSGKMWLFNLKSESAPRRKASLNGRESRGPRSGGEYGRTARVFY